MATKKKEVKTGTIPVDTAFHIIEHLEIPDMENWGEAVGMQEQFMIKILKTKQMHKRLESLLFMNLTTMNILAANDFTLTFKTMHRIIRQGRSRSKWYVANLDENIDTSIQKVHFEFMLMEEAEKFIEVRSTSEEGF